MPPEIVMFVPAATDPPFAKSSSVMRSAGQQMVAGVGVTNNPPLAFAPAAVSLDTAAVGT